MSNTIIALLVGLVAMGGTTLVYPFVLQFAKDHDIVDNPNARKLQRMPVPVLGGLVVYIGIMMGCLVLMALHPEPILAYGMLAMTIMLMVGIWDDIKELSATFRFVFEIFLVGIFIWKTGYYIDDLHGLCGIHAIEPWLGLPLSVVFGVGLINAVNLIDGVDGYSSGYGMLACMCFAITFHSTWSMTMLMVSVIVMGALFPFFMHNVFGVRSKMFIGDGGTLMLGMILVMFSFSALSSKSNCDSLEDYNICLPALVLAVLCVPIFDTLRVMTMRMVRGKSPFRPDKTHLHHLFIDLGFSHLGAGASILIINLMVVMLWMVTWLAGGTMELQFGVVLLLGFLVTFGFYHQMRVAQNGGPLDEEGYPLGSKLWHALVKIGGYSHREKGRIWRGLRWMMDSKVLNPTPGPKRKVYA